MSYDSKIAAAKRTLHNELAAIRAMAARANEAIGKRAATAGPDLVAEAEERKVREAYSEACEVARYADPEGYRAAMIRQNGRDPFAPPSDLGSLD